MNSYPRTVADSKNALLDMEFVTLAENGGVMVIDGPRAGKWPERDRISEKGARGLWLIW